MESSHGLKMLEAHFNVLSEEQCLALLSQEAVGRVGISVGSLPVILPVKFVFDDGRVVFRTSFGTKLRAATANKVVAFEVDSYDPTGSSGWSVLVQGIASRVTDPLAVHHSNAALGASWGIVAADDDLVQIEVGQISGRQFGVATT